MDIDDFDEIFFLLLLLLAYRRRQKRQRVHTGQSGKDYKSKPRPSGKAANTAVTSASSVPNTSMDCSNCGRLDVDAHPEWESTVRLVPINRAERNHLVERWLEGLPLARRRSFGLSTSKLDISRYGYGSEKWPRQLNIRR
jgi:hypothetical protein